MAEYLFSSESVSCGHPDKICDQISDAILDYCLERDKNSRVACEVLFKGFDVVIAGEITSSVDVNQEVLSNLVLQVLEDANYGAHTLGCEFSELRLHNFLSKQSEDISRGVNQDNKLGAGDQGIMFGFATVEAPDFMPFGIYYAHRLMERHKHVCKAYPTLLGPDAKCQLTVQYEDGKPVKISRLVFSSQHFPDVRVEKLKELIVEEIVKKVLPSSFLDGTEYYVNPTGRFVVGGPVADCGLTGRKIIVDTYGGYSRHGGGAFSGKDPTKVDRSGAYVARHIAKKVVALGWAEKVEVQLGYCIGKPEPVSFCLNTFGTEKMKMNEILEFIRTRYDLSVSGIINQFDLLNQKYLPTAAFGHFGRSWDGSFSWENVD
ncbi:MAG: methionine adenosyltransferase [Deltaproteobacteria bacterium]|nr:methionine adenosyltransferase [Deltaproteobacteria bacterium]